MGQALVKLWVECADSNAADVAAELDALASEPQQFVNQFISRIAAMASGSKGGEIIAHIEDVSTFDLAESTATCVSVIATDVLTIGKVSLTVVASAANENQVTVGGTDTLMATAFAAAINAHSELQGVVTATSSAGVVTITAVAPGELFEHIATESPDATITVNNTHLTVAGTTAFSEETAERTFDYGGT